MFNQLIEDDELNFNPAANIGKLNKKRDIAAQETDELDEESVYDMGEVARALDKAKEVKPHYQPVFACGFLSGLRMGEQIALRPMDLDFHGHLIRVRRNYYRGRITTPKAIDGAMSTWSRNWRRRFRHWSRARKPRHYVKS
jgi:hypothetical protein